jgi:hypothetical protein
MLETAASPLDAWAQVRASGTPDPHHALGVTLPHLQ